MIEYIINLLRIYADDDTLAVLSDDVGGLWCRPIAVLESPPDSITFLRDYVHPNIPCVINNAISSNNKDDTPLTITLDDIIDIVGEDTKITVDVTPDGHGDCIRSVVEEESNSSSDGHHSKNTQQHRMFVKPHEQSMEIRQFRDLLRRCDGNSTLSNNMKEEDKDTVDSSTTDLKQYPLYNDDDHQTTEHNLDEECFDDPPVVYYSRQNDCLRTELPTLSKLFPPTIQFAQEAFGTGEPDAINLWMGNERSVSSMYKDHYENCFYVCSGQKEFILCPPADVVFLQESEFVTGTFHRMSDGSWAVVADNSNDKEDQVDIEPNTTKWVEPDVKKYMEGDERCRSEFPLLAKANPVKVLVKEGQMLYIPSLWYHRVTQTCETVGINYWYDMKFDSLNWCYFNFLQNLRRGDRLSRHMSRVSL